MSPAITLTEEKETLLVPLWSKAVEGKRTAPILVDPKATEILDRIDYDFKALAIPGKTASMLCIRAVKLDETTRQFLQKHPAGPVLHLGCGLDARCERVERKGAIWFDLDYPEVIELRRNFFAEGDGYRMLPASVTDLEWLAEVPRADAALVVAEGLSMYLRREELQALFGALLAHFTLTEIVLDAYSRLTARRAASHPSIRKTGATIHWGVDDPHDIEKWGVKASVLEEWSFTQSEAISQLDLVSRTLFRLAGYFQTARRAHRILRISLGGSS